MEFTYKKEIDEINRIVEEQIELEYYGRRNSACQFWVLSISGISIPEDHVLLISIDKTSPEANVLYHDYYGVVEIFYCKKRKGLLGKEKLKQEKTFRKLYTRKQWKEKTEKIRLMDFL